MSQHANCSYLSSKRISMTFKAYDIFSSLLPGFLLLLAALNLLGYNFDKDLVVAYTPIAFLLGYIINTVSSWLEDLYFLTWGGKPSSRLLEGKSIWKVKFYHAARAKASLLQESSASASPSSDELFSIAMRHANGQKDTRVEDFNGSYALSRSLLTSVFLASILVLVKNYYDWRYYAILIPTVFVMWLRCKQRAYYYCKEVLDVYLKAKNP